MRKKIMTAITAKRKTTRELNKTVGTTPTYSLITAQQKMDQLITSEMSKELALHFTGALNEFAKKNVPFDTVLFEHGKVVRLLNAMQRTKGNPELNAGEIRLIYYKLLEQYKKQGFF